MVVAALLAMISVSTAPAANAAAAAACDVSAAVARVLPAVVKILAVRVVRENGEPSGIEYFVGTGMIIDPSGIIVTNKHVIKDAAMIRVTFQDRSQVTAQLIAAADLADLALLKVNGPQAAADLVLRQQRRGAGRPAGDRRGQSAGDRHLGQHRRGQRVEPRPHALAIR